MREDLYFLKLGEIKPRGWIYKQMKKDLTEGFVGKLDKLVPDLIVNDDIYGKNRLTKNLKSKDVGAIAQDEAWEVQYLWWNSETQSNWWDGLVRNAILTDNKEYLKKANEYVERMLSNQDEDGYLGIYGKDLRYNFQGENGELWAQATLFRALLGYFEATEDNKILEAVEKAMTVTMTAYPINASTPFNVKDSYAGLCHGLAIVDVLEKLYEITKKENYLDYAVWLYEDYSKHLLSEEDVQLKNLLNDSYKFKGHGVHTYEHLRAVIIAAYHSKDNTYKEALEGYLNKLSLCLCPSGGPIGDEWIAENTANPSLTGYEYCSIHELLHSYTLLLQRSGDMTFADKTEWLLFNAGQGARHVEESSIAYLKSDNSYSMEGVFQAEQTYVPNKVQTRYKYSPTHQDAAVCCVPNAGRIYPYYIQSMWMKSDSGLTAMLYGPCKVKTNIDGVEVGIEEDTNYPFTQNINFKVSVEKPVYFEITLRKPSWCKEAKITAMGAEVSEQEDIIFLRKQWSNEDEIKISFDYNVEVHEDFQKDCFLSYGPLVYSLPIEGKATVVKDFGFNNFRELKYSPLQQIPEYLEFTKEGLKAVCVLKTEIAEEKPWKKSIKLETNLYNNKLKKEEKVTLVPMGGTLLRKVTFKKKVEA